MMKTFDFSNIMLLPKQCVLETREDADVSAKLGNRTFKLPITMAPMPSVIDEVIAIKLAESGHFYVMHRFNGIDLVEFAQKMRSFGLFVSISVGVKKESYDLLTKLKELEIVPEYVTIDVAHAHNIRVKHIIEHIRSLFGEDTFVLAGTVATPEAVKDLEEWGADAVRVGIGMGHVCTTSIRTGFGTRCWQLSAVAECAKVSKKVLICDGGMSTSGDLVKALHMGADWAMSGFLFSGLTDSPGEVVKKDGVSYKKYYGNASSVLRPNRIEGIQRLVECDRSLADKLKELKEDLQSAVSYAGGTKLEDLRHADHVFIASAPPY